MSVRILHGDCRAILPTLAAGSVQSVVTSPPYWGLRDYGTASWEGGEAACAHRQDNAHQRAELTGGGCASWSTRDVTVRARGACTCGARRIDQQLGLEPTPEEYVARMVEVFREVRRVLRADGTCWVNMGDGYCSAPAGNAGQCEGISSAASELGSRATERRAWRRGSDLPLKPKDLVGMPWRLAFALQADGWFLRADIVWAKPNPMPESVVDRPTKAHEYIFLLTKSARYYYDADAVREPQSTADHHARYHTKTSGRVEHNKNGSHGMGGGHGGLRGALNDPNPAGRNLRSVWTIPSAPFPEAHFATFPPALASRCLQAGTSAKGCCAACGAPWARQVERGDLVKTNFDCGNTRPHQNGKAMVAGHKSGHLTRDGFAPGHAYPTTTTGWHPSCACDPSTPVVPCTVLDPFGGSGTVGMVAEQLGRHSILIELSPAYCAMARERTAQLGLFTQSPAA